jgi:hypothetical protein
MNLKNCFIIIVAIIILGSCVNRTTNRENSIEVINVNPHEAKEYVNLSELADSIVCIKLQPAPGDVMGKVLQIVVKKKYIYALDISQMMVFVFDKTGKFISKLNKRGEGADEYRQLGNLLIDDNEEYIEFIDWMKSAKFKYVNISFELVEVSTIPHVIYNTCRKSNGFYYLATYPMDNVINGKKTNAELVVMDDKNTMKTLFDKNIETNSIYVTVNIESFTQNDQNELFVSTMSDNTFYRLEAGEAYPVFTVDFGKYGINSKKVGLLSTKELLAYINEIDGLASFPILNVNNSNIMSFSYFFRQKSNKEDAARKQFGVLFGEKEIRQYIKIQDKIYHVKKIINDLTNFPTHLYIGSCFFECIHEVWHEDYLIDVIMPNFYFADDGEKTFVEGLGEMTADDDPIVVMMKLKKNK